MEENPYLTVALVAPIPCRDRDVDEVIVGVRPDAKCNDVRAFARIIGYVMRCIVEHDPALVDSAWQFAQGVHLRWRLGEPGEAIRDEHIVVSAGWPRGIVVETHWTDNTHTLHMCELVAGAVPAIAAYFRTTPAAVWSLVESERPDVMKEAVMDRTGEVKDVAAEALAHT
jgi:hypothetical protein